MKKSGQLYSRSKFYMSIVETFPDLKRLKKKGSREDFYKLILIILPKIKKYINGRLERAIGKGHFSKNKYSADEFIDQLFIEVYDHIDEVQNAEDFYTWLFKKTEDLLEDTIVEEEFDEFFFRNINDFSQREWEEMEEKFSVDASGDLQMLEDLDGDEVSLNNEYSLDKVFVRNDERELIANLDRELTKEKIDRHVKMVLHKLPLPMQIVFDLFTNHHLTLEEIAEIKGSTKEEVRQLLFNAQRTLKASIYNRYQPQ